MIIIISLAIIVLLALIFFFYKQIGSLMGGINNYNEENSKLKKDKCNDDDGKNYYEKGQITEFIGPGEGSEGWDYCFTPFNEINMDEGGQPGTTGSHLLEWICDD